MSAQSGVPLFRFSRALAVWLRHVSLPCSGFLRPAGADVREVVLCACCTSQLSALPPKTLDSRTAISGDMPRFSFTSSDKVVRVTPRAAASSLMLKLKGSIHWRKTTPPGCGGFFIVISGIVTRYVTRACAFLGRPPSLPLARTAFVLAWDEALPPALPS
jgi:hypothetical protein